MADELLTQTGITSAFGLALESTFRTVPKTLITGNRHQPGKDATNPLRYMIVESGGSFGGKPEITTPDDEIDGDVELVRTIHTANTYSGGYSFKVDAENVYYIALGVLGRDAQTELVAPAGAAPAVEQHVMTPNKYAPSFTGEEDLGDGNYGRLSSGIIINETEFTFGDVITCKFTGMPHRQIPNTYPDADLVPTNYKFGSATTNVLPLQMGGDGTALIERTPSPVYVDVLEEGDGNGPLTFSDMQFGTETGFAPAGEFGGAFLTIDDVPYPCNILKGNTLSITRQVTSQQVGGSGKDPGATTGGGIQVGGKISLLFSDMEVPAAALRHGKIGLNFRFVGIQIGATGQYYTIEVYLPHCKLQEAGAEVVSGPLLVGGTFRARKDFSKGYSIKLTLINSTSNALLEGDAGSVGSAGGLGGWNKV